MQVYFDLEKKTLTTKSNNYIYEGSINANKLEVFVKVTDNTQQLYNSAFFSITALMSNGRKIGHFTHDGVINSTIIDGDYYNILTFTLTKENGYTLSAGILNVTLWLNVTNSNAQLVSREAVGNILINVKETTQVDDNILIVDASGETIYNFQTAIIAIQDSQSKLGLQLTKIEEKMIKNLGTISGYTDLNDILEVGYYIFSLYSESSGTTYLNIMEVESTNSYVLQTILEIGIDQSSLMKRTYTISSKAWTTSSDTFVMMSHIQDNLNSKSKQFPLSANQGRILNEKITETNTNVLNLDNRVKTLESNQGSGSNGGNAEPVNLTKKIPVPNLFGASEIYFDTSKSIDEVVNVLRQLEYYEGNYVICEHMTGGWYYFSVYHNTDEDYFKIYFENDDADLVLFDNIDGWSSENIVSGKFEIPTNLKGGGCINYYGLQNDLLLDFIWCEESVYVRQKDTVSIDDINMAFDYSENDGGDTYESYRKYNFNFIGETLQNKNVVLDVTKYLQNGEENKIDEFIINTNVPKNCKMTIILPNSFSHITIFDMFMFNIVDNIHFRNDTLNHVVEEGVHHPFGIENVFNLCNMDEEYNYLYFIVIEWDADGFATINLLQDYEF